MIDEDKLEFLEGMVYCGTNRPVNERPDFLESIISSIKGGDEQDFDQVRVIFPNGIRRIGTPKIWLPYLDNSDGEGYGKVGLTFTDSNKLEIIRFRLYQMNDDNAYARMCGNSVEYIIDLTDRGSMFDRLSLPTQDYLSPEKKSNLIEKYGEGVIDDIEKYISPLIHSYERSLKKLKTIHRNIIIPLESEKTLWKNVAYRHKQLYDIGGLPEYVQLMDAINNTANQPMRQLGRPPEEL